MDSENDFTITIATKNDLPKIIDYLKNEFYRDEPLNVSIKLIDSIGLNSTAKDLCLEGVEDGFSFIATDNLDQIIGVCLNEVQQRYEVSQDAQVTNPTLNMIFKLLDHTKANVKMFKKFSQIDKILSVNIISVSSQWRGRGVAQRLLIETRNFAKELGIHLIEVYCTSYFSTKLMQKLGFDCVHSQRYSDYTENGKQVFFPEYPHTELSVMVLLL